MIYGLTEKDLEEIDKEGVKYLIAIEEKRLQTWSIPNYEKQEIKNRIKELKKLLYL